MKRLALLLVALLTVYACNRYDTGNVATLERRVAASFPIGTPARDMVQALTAEGYLLSGPNFTGTDALPWCLRKRSVGALQLAGSATMSVCFNQDNAGAITRRNVERRLNNF